MTQKGKQNASSHTVSKTFSSFFLIAVEQSMRSSNERAIFASVGQAD